ncbi:ribosome assembly factor SBDS [Candidatus Bathyarchaeota archaeon]|nr:MAG: ribosome assembly factor SBDS [Candidatus Hecatellales archaeon]RLI35246.1 MAG: ribosome assembly factor SBDS [Candidatus Bathyarchaeota archaeon]
MGQKFTIARLVVGGERFEIMINPDKALDYKLGKPVSISQLLVYETIFKDVSKGERASEEKLRKVFGTTDPLKIAKTIVDRGEIQLTTEQRRKLIEDKKRQIINFISRHCVDPKTGLPHPPLRIEQAMAEAHVSIDPYKDAEEQAKQVIQALRPILPLKVENVELEVVIPSKYAYAAYSTLRNFGAVKREQWQADGSLKAVVEIPAGLQPSFVEKLASLTKGSAHVKKI